MDVPSSPPMPQNHHPVLQVLSGVIKESEERFILDDEGAELLSYSLIRHGDDPTLLDALLTLMILAASWGKTPHEAAGVRILEIIANVRPQLTILDRSNASTQAVRKFLDQPQWVAQTPQVVDIPGGVARFRAIRDRKERK